MKQQRGNNMLSVMMSQLWFLCLKRHFLL